MSHVIRSTLWLSFFAIILLAWWMMYAMATGMGLDLIGRSTMEMGSMEMNTTFPMEEMGQSDADMSSMGMTMDAEGAMPMTSDMDMGAMDMGAMDMAMMTQFGPLFGMWAAMMAAMMLPTMVPTLRAYEDLMLSANGTRIGWTGVLVGYFIAWVAFAAIITGAQLMLLRLGLIDMMGMAVNTWIAGGLLLAVGLFQFTRAKEICHGVCHSPTTYFLGHWNPTALGGVKMGLGLGAFCVGCCWGFMALGFVGGVMSLLWMGLATLFMVIEKLPQVGHVVTKPMGVILSLSGIAVMAYPYVMGG